jgi:hypothetical protein
MKHLKPGSIAQNLIQKVKIGLPRLGRRIATSFREWRTAKTVISWCLIFGAYLLLFLLPNFPKFAIVLFLAYLLIAAADLGMEPLDSFGKRFLRLIGKLSFRFSGLVGFVLLFSIVGHQFLRLLPKSDVLLDRLVVATGFQNVQKGQYMSLEPNSSVAFLPGDRLCVAELLRNGKHRFHSVRREELK